MGLIQQSLCFIKRQWFAPDKALNKITLMLFEYFKLRFVFNTFGNYLAVHNVAHVDN